MNADFLKKNAENIVSWGVFFILLATYWLTVHSSLRGST